MPSYFYVYPSYLKKATPRAEGRRIPLPSAVTGNLEPPRLLAACKALGYEAELEERHYPREAWRNEGRLKVTKREGVTKQEFLRALARELQRTSGAPSPER
jgi:signal recognition particle subunit SEC65